VSQTDTVEVKTEDEFDADAEFKKAVEDLAGQGSDLPGAETETNPKDTTADEHGQEDVPPADAVPPAEPTDKDTDIWATADPALKAAFEAEQAKVARLETTANSHARSASQLGRRIAELEALVPKGKKGDGAPAGETDEAREARYARLREEYGDSVGEILPELESLRAELAELKSGFAGVQHERTETDVAQQYAILNERHPNWRQDVVSESYVAWAQTQPPPVLEAIQRNAEQLSDGATAAWVLDLWKRDTAPPANPEKEKLAERRQEQREANRSADVRNPPVTGKDEPTDTDGLWKAEMARRERKR
jgi:hypothetical protein